MENQTQSKAVVKSDKKTIENLLKGDAFKSQVAMVLPRHLKPDRFIRVALTAMTRTPKLAQCDQQSFFQALLSLSQYGLEPDGRRAHLIPFENRKRNCVECQLIVDYKGLVELVMRSGQVSNIHADVVCENDEFDYDLGEIRKHKVNFKEPRGKMFAAYARVVFKDGTSKSEVLPKEDVDAIRSRSRAGNAGPWVTDYNEMAKKTAFRRCSKWLTLSPELQDAIEADDDQFDLKAAKVVESPVIFAKPAFEIESPAEPEVDDVPMDGPTPQAKEEKAQESKPQAAGIFAPAPKVQESNPLAVVPGSSQAEISEVLEGAGVTFDSFRKWLADSDGIATDSWESWAQVPAAICEGFKGGPGGKRLAKLVTMYGNKS